MGAGAASMSKVLDDVVDLQRIETGEFTLNFIPCSLRQMLAQSISMLRLWAANKQVRLRGEAGVTIVTISMSPLCNYRFTCKQILAFLGLC